MALKVRGHLTRSFLLVGSCAPPATGGGNRKPCKRTRRCALPQQTQGPPRTAASLIRRIGAQIWWTWMTYITPFLARAGAAVAQMLRTSRGQWGGPSPVCPAPRRAIDSPGGCSGSCGRTATSTSTSPPPEGRPRLGEKGVEGVRGHPGRGADAPLAGSVKRVLQDGARWWPSAATKAPTSRATAASWRGRRQGSRGLASLVLDDRATRRTLVERGGMHNGRCWAGRCHARNRPRAGHRAISPVGCLRETRSDSPGSANHAGSPCWWSPVSSHVRNARRPARRGLRAACSTARRRCGSVVTVTSRVLSW